MDDRAALHALANALGVHTHYVDGLGQAVEVADATLLRVCTTLGVPVAELDDCPLAWIAYQSREVPAMPAVMVAWDGVWQVPGAWTPPAHAVVELENGDTIALAAHGRDTSLNLPLGYHRLRVHNGAASTVHNIIAAPVRAFQHPALAHSWGVAGQLSALRSLRSRALGDLVDLEVLCRWVRAQGGRVVTLLPLLPTFNTEPTEPSPYSAVSRLFWSELVLDLKAQHHATGPVERLDVSRGHAEVWQAITSTCQALANGEAELEQYALFRAAQSRWGRNWRDWPERARTGDLHDIDADDPVAHFHRCAQMMARDQLQQLGARLADLGVFLGLDLTVGVHPDGYDAWSRQGLFAPDVSVGAPPDGGFPSGQDWGFSPILPHASRDEGHRYFAESLRHQMAVAGVLRVDHIMALTRLYWIPHGMGLHEGTYVSYPADELFAVLTLESHRNKCEVIGENLGTVPVEVSAALDRHGVRGLYLALYQATGDEGSRPPHPNEVAMIGSHDTPTLAGWLRGEDIEERVRHELLAPEAVAAELAARSRSITGLASVLGLPPSDPAAILVALLGWLGQSEARIVLPWLEDCWLEPIGVNLPGTPAFRRANWQRPMRLTLEELMAEPLVTHGLSALESAREDVAGRGVAGST